MVADPPRCNFTTYADAYLFKNTVSICLYGHSRAVPGLNESISHNIRMHVLCCVSFPTLILFNGDGWRLLVKAVLSCIFQLRVGKKMVLGLFYLFFYSFIPQTSRSRFSKPPGTFIAADAVLSGGQLTGDK